jgi:hypothetical protein
VKGTKTHAWRRIVLDDATLSVLDDQRRRLEERATLNVYAHFLEASDRQAADVIGGLLD